MFFETSIVKRESLHPQLHDSHARWEQGEVFHAFNTGFRTLELENEKHPSASYSSWDWIFLSEVAQSCCRFNRSRAIFKNQSQKNPDDRLINLLHAWDLSAHGNFAKATALLERTQQQVTPVAQSVESCLPALIDAVHSYNYSVMGWHETARRHHKRSKDQADGHEVVWYVLSRASACRTDWQHAVEEGSRVLELRPGWARAKSALIDSLLATGNLNGAVELLNAKGNFRFDPRLEFSRATCYEVAGDIDSAINQLRTISQWPIASRLQRFAIRKLVLLLMNNDHPAEAREIVERHQIAEFEELSKCPSNSPKRYIPAPLVSQTINHCVPTVAAMVAGSQGVPARAIDYAEAMGTRHGTPMWRMVDHMRSLGFRCECVLPEADIVEKMLDQNVPLVGCLTGLFSSHVDVVCGYDQGLKVFHIRDPMHWYGSSIKYDSLTPRYEKSTSLWAMVAPHRIKEVEIKPDWLNVPGQAYVDLGRACNNGDRIAAEDAYAKIPHDSGLNLASDMRANGIVITAKQLEKRLRELAQFPETSDEEQEVDLRQIQAMLRLIDENNADEIVRLARANEQKLSKKLVEYVESLAVFAKGEWVEARNVFESLAANYPSMDSLWSQLSEIHLQLGNAADAERCLNTAIEIAPENDSLRSRWLQQNKNKLTFAQRLESAQSLVRRFDNEPETRFMLADVLEDSPDGLEYEKCMRDCIRFFPRFPGAYRRLADWYLNQSRDDLAKVVLAEGRALIGEDELPKYECELEQPKEEAVPAKTEETNPSQSPANTATEATAPNNVSPDAPGIGSPTSSSDDQLLQNVWRKAFEVSSDELESLDDFKALVKSQETGKLRWWQSARLTCARIINLMNDRTEGLQNKPQARLQKLEMILPENPPGIPEAFAEAILTSLNTQSFDRMTLTVIRQWIEKVAKNHKRFPGLEFERAYLVELCGLFNDSEQSLKELIQNHPAYSPAFYRLAQLELSRGNVLAARKLFEQCLEIEPGHWGSLSEMARLAGIESDFKQEAKYRRSIYDRLPYSMRYLFDTTMAIKGANGASAATEFMTVNQSLFGDCSFRVGQARYFFEIGETEQAKMLVQDVPLDNEFGYAAAWVRLDCAVRQENFDEAEVIMEPMLKKWPKDRDLIDQVARLFRLRSPAVAAAFACEKLKEGIDLPVLAYIAIQNEKRPYEKVTEVLSLTQTENREAVALSFFEALDRPAFDRDCMQFLEFCSNTFPRLQGLRETYASRLMLRNEHLKSVAISKALLDEEPENPRWMELYGMCIQDKDPKGSIAVLEKAYQLTGSTHVLSRLARGHNANGDKQKAKDTYLAVIALNPQDTIAIVNLMLLFDVMDDAMWMRVNSCLDTGAGIDTQYFHVMAVKLALKLGKPLSTAWFDGAQRRFADLANQSSFRDEKTCLDRALNAWLHVRPIKGVKVGSFISRLIGRFYWPGLAWIPRE